MAYEQRDNSGSAFPNDKRESENHPHFRGTAKIGGVEYWHSIWKKKTKDGTIWLSSSYQEKEPRAAPGMPMQTPDADFEDDIPF